MQVQSEMGGVEIEVRFDEAPHLATEGSGNALGRPPEDAVVDDKHICSRVQSAVDSAMGGVHSHSQFIHFHPTFDL